MVKGAGSPGVTMIIFGISGDLSHRYILPALSTLAAEGKLPSDFKLVGLSRKQITPADVLNKATSSLKEHLSVFKLDMADEQDYRKLKQKLGTDRQLIFYFAVPPPAILPIVRHMGGAGLNGPNVKLLLEKPFGVDLDSAAELIAEIKKHFSEAQTYRIDHYLAKSMAQNIAVFLSSNALVRRIWSKDFIDYVEIVAAEKIGIEGRVDFYEATGALRDFVQSHLLQLAALVLMEPCPDAFDFKDLPARRAKALAHLSAEGPASRGQYDGYRQEVKNPRTITETFVALKLTSRDPRWAGVPIYMATGKKLDQRLTQIRVNFKKDSAGEANQLIIRVQPHEGIELDMWARRPGYASELQKKTLSFSYEQDFNDRLPDAYEQVVFDAIAGRSGLFASSSEVLESWRILQPILSAWQMKKDDLITYKAGSTVEEVLDLAYNKK